MRHGWLCTFSTKTFTPILGSKNISKNFQKKVFPVAGLEEGNIGKNRVSGSTVPQRVQGGDTRAARVWGRRRVLGAILGAHSILKGDLRQKETKFLMKVGLWRIF
jgi:hypothetical protein